MARLTRAPGNDAPIGGLKVVTERGWFAARPSGTEDVAKLYAESFVDEAHLGPHHRGGAGHPARGPRGLTAAEPDDGEGVASSRALDHDHAKIAFIGSHGIRKTTAALAFAGVMQRAGRTSSSRGRSCATTRWA